MNLPLSKINKMYVKCDLDAERKFESIMLTKHAYLGINYNVFKLYEREKVFATKKILRGNSECGFKFKESVYKCENKFGLKPMMLLSCVLAGKMAWVRSPVRFKC